VNAQAGAQLNLLEWQRRRGDEKEAVLSLRAAPPLSRATGDCSRYRRGNSPIGSVACSAVSYRGNGGRTARWYVLMPSGQHTRFPWLLLFASGRTFEGRKPLLVRSGSERDCQRWCRRPSRSRFLL